MSNTGKCKICGKPTSPAATIFKNLSVCSHRCSMAKTKKTKQVKSPKAKTTKNSKSAVVKAKK